MHVTHRFPHLAGVLLLLAAPFAGAESPLPDPVAPAVVGRPLDQIRPARPAHPKAAAKPVRREQVASAGKVARPLPPPAVALAPAAVPPAPPPRQVAIASRPLGPAAYFSGKDHALVSDYYAAHPTSGQPARWRVGEPIPPRAALTGVPDDLRAALPALSRGYQYVQVDGEVVLVAVPSRVVVAGISRNVH